MRQTHDCPPTLNDSQVLDFCKNGYLFLPGVVGAETNTRVLQYLDQDTGTFPHAILAEPWFIDGVIRNPQAAGAVRSLLGKDFLQPNCMVNHRGKCPVPAVSAWHCDGLSDYGPKLKYLQVFYQPQDVDADMGPTELVPGSHAVRNTGFAMGHLQDIAGTVKAVGPAGSIFITNYAIWHRRGRARAVGPIRHLLKYCYWRSNLPTRDWIHEPGFEVGRAVYVMEGQTLRDHSRESVDSAERYLWLCGRHQDFRAIGGQAWPNSHALTEDSLFAHPDEQIPGLFA